MPNTKQNLIGKVFGHLIVIGKSEERGTQHEYKWVCQCDCGKLTTVTTAALNSGSITSCGHVRLEKSREKLIISFKNQVFIVKLLSNHC